MTRGVSMLKYHLAQIPGYEVGICPKTTPKIIVRAKQAIERFGKKKELKEALRRELGLGGTSRSKATPHTFGGG